MDNENFFKWLDSVPEVEPDEWDLELLAQAEAENDGTTVDWEKFKEQLNCSGRVNVRMPKSMHIQLAFEAKSEGVSLNQYILYKLAKDLDHSA